MAELESFVDALNKKLEIKDRNMALCNSELSKVLCENKKLKVEHEKYKESSVYYEGLYNSLNSQNAYLNSQLNKMLKMGEYSKDIEGYIMKFKKKLKRRKKIIKKLEQENNKLKVGAEETRSPEDTSDSLLKKIEDLNDKNEKYKKQISDLENEKRKLEYKAKNINIEDDEFREKVRSILNKKETVKPSEHGLREDFRSFPVEHKYPKYKYEAPAPYLGFRDYNRPAGLASKYDVNKPTGVLSSYSKPTEMVSNYSKPVETLLYKPVETNYKPVSNYATTHTPYPSAEIPKTANHDMSYLKLFNLDHDYGEDARQNNDFIGGFVDDSNVPRPKLEVNYSKEMEPAGNGGSVQMNNFDRLFMDKADDNASIESVKTYHTSSTLKEMMAKTENLQKKFEDLENKLAQINEGESIDRLTDKIKTCNSYYSEWNADSNESDYI